MEPRGRGRILVVDERDLRRAGVASLFAPWAEARGVATVGCSPREALSEVETGEPLALVVVSLGSSALTERETHRFLKVLRALAPAAPVVALSDREAAADVHAALRLGLDGYLPTSMAPELALQACAFIIGGGSYFPPAAIRDLRTRDAGPGAPDDGGGAAAALGERDDAQERKSADRTESERAASERPPDGRGRPGPDTAAQAELDETATPDREDPEPDDETKGALMTSRQREVLDLLREGQPNKLIARRLGMTEATVKVHVRHIMRKLGANNRTQAAINALELDPPLGALPERRTVTAIASARPRRPIAFVSREAS